jgi:hypothetical protein
MSLFESFNSTFLISLGLTLLLISLLYFFIINKFAEQDHKLNSMFSLVSTMAGEQQYFRSKLSSIPNIDKAQFASHMFLNEDHENMNSINNNENNDELISVSDNSSSEYDGDEDSEIDTNYDEGDEGDEGDEYDNSDYEEDIKVNNIDMLNLSLINPENIHLKDDDNSSQNANEHISQIIDIGENEFQNLEKIDNINDVKTIHLEEPIDIHSEINDINETASIVNFSLKSENNDYKKLSLNKLRELAVEKKLVHDASKLKKNDILKLLGDE